MNGILEQIGIGQRVRVIDGGLPNYGQIGTVVAVSIEHNWYVHLDSDGTHDRPFFQVEELEIVHAVPVRV